VSLPALLRRPALLGLVIGAVSLPLVLVSGPAGPLVAFAALCLYPLLVTPLTVAQPSWWRAAILSTLVWLAVFSILGGTASARRHLGDDAMIFLVPFMMYPLALSIAALVRLERKVRGRPAASGLRAAVLLGGLACALLVGFPLAMNLLPFVAERVTGNSPPNSVIAADGVVTDATGEGFVASLGGRSESLRITPETRFGFTGSGKPPADAPAGPSWLKAGQRVSLEYVFRGHRAEARYVGVVIERAGCAGDPKWAAAQAGSPAPTDGASLSGTRWYGWDGEADAPAPDRRTLFEFLEGGRLAYTDSGTRRTRAGWRQSGSTVLIEINDCYAMYEARVDGDEMKGEFSNEKGARRPWAARRDATRSDTGTR
jgi:hypothetical protein